MKLLNMEAPVEQTDGDADTTIFKSCSINPFLRLDC